MSTLGLYWISGRHVNVHQFCLFGVLVIRQVTNFIVSNSNLIEISGNCSNIDSGLSTCKASDNIPFTLVVCSVPAGREMGLLSDIRRRMGPDMPELGPGGRKLKQKHFTG